MPVAAIHQPNFFPWLGYFRKIAVADVFVFLDAVPFPKNSWVNRVKVRVGDEARWITCPVRRAAAGTEIRATEIDEHGRPWRRKVLGTLEMNYRRTAHGGAVLPWIERMLRRDERSLASFNAENVGEIARALGLRARLVRQSELRERDVFEARGSARLAAICRAVGADTYLAGDGAEAYEDEAAYERAGVVRRRLGFVHPEYDQGRGGFVPGLSILDALLHLGVAGTADLLTGAAPPASPPPRPGT